MRSGKPKTSATAPARQTARNNDTATMGAIPGKPTRKARRTLPRKSLLAVICRDPRLTKADKTSIMDAYENGLTVQDLAALTVYELRLALQFYDDAELSAKDLIIGINKAASHVAASAQLATAAPGTSADITITFAGSGLSSDRPEAAAPGTPDPVIGDAIASE